MDDAAKVETYYNERVAGKLGDFTACNPRIEAAVATIAEWAPWPPRRVLEIGCGVGATTWRMARAWPRAQVIGADISRTSIEVAQTCFKRRNLAYQAGLVTEASMGGPFDLVVLMDVYEHIAPADRASLHAAIKSGLAERGRVIMTVPTAKMQAFLRADMPDRLQPVDEDIGLDVIATFARETGTELASFRQVGIWRYGDYAHLVFGRLDFDLVQVRAQPPGGMRSKVKKALGLDPRPGRRDYLGFDVGVARRSRRLQRFEVSPAERARLASAWATARREADKPQ
ncbi:MAG TPA: class I SAM-dependent methyltransferase [Caulobacteraceae bacterium]